MKKIRIDEGAWGWVVAHQVIMLKKALECPVLIKQWQFSVHLFSKDHLIIYTINFCVKNFIQFGTVNKCEIKGHSSALRLPTH